MTSSITRLAELQRFERATPGGPAKADRCSIGVALCILVLLAAAPANAHAQGRLVAWGSDGFGVVSGTPDGAYTAVAAGGTHSVAIRTDGTLVSWGDDFYGQISGTPAGTFFAVAAGGAQSVAIHTDGTLVFW